MSKKASFQPGQLVVCVRTNDPRFSYLVGATGEIKQLLPSFLAMLVESDCEVYFPAFRDALCQHCHNSHKGKFAMSFNELKPLDDPDKGEETPRITKIEETIDAPEFGFVTVE